MVVSLLYVTINNFDEINVRNLDSFATLNNIVMIMKTLILDVIIVSIH